jgi:hypothetical protein
MLSLQERGFIVPEKYHDDLLDYISRNGATGVNELAKELNIPLSTMQRYLERQTYFKKTSNRKWDLPEKVIGDIKTSTLTLMVGGVENALKLLDAQMQEMQQQLRTAMMPIDTLRRGVENIKPPVAGTSNGDIDSRLYKLQEDMALVPKLIKTHIDKIPEEYHDILNNVDWILLYIEKGREFFAERVSSPIASLITSDTEQLPDDALVALERYQK